MLPNIIDFHNYYFVNGLFTKLVKILSLSFFTINFDICTYHKSNTYKMVPLKRKNIDVKLVITIKKLTFVLVKYQQFNLQSVTICHISITYTIRMLYLELKHAVV